MRLDLDLVLQELAATPKSVDLKIAIGLSLGCEVLQFRLRRRGDCIIKIASNLFTDEVLRRVIALAVIYLGRDMRLYALDRRISTDMDGVFFNGEIVELWLRERPIYIAIDQYEGAAARVFEDLEVIQQRFERYSSRNAARG